RDEVHFDAREDRVVEGVVTELVERKGGAELAVQAPQNVEVEGGGDAERVVVGAVEHQRVFLEVDPEQQPATWATDLTDAAQEAPGVPGTEVPQRRARVVRHAAFGRPPRDRQLKGRGVVSADRQDLQPRIARDQLPS